MTSIPSANFTPWISFGNWLWPSIRRQLFWAPSTNGDAYRLQPERPRRGGGPRTQRFVVKGARESRHLWSDLDHDLVTPKKRQCPGRVIKGISRSRGL